MVKTDTFYLAKWSLILNYRSEILYCFLITCLIKMWCRLNLYFKLSLPLWYAVLKSSFHFRLVLTLGFPQVCNRIAGTHRFHAFSFGFNHRRFGPGDDTYFRKFTFNCSNLYKKKIWKLYKFQLNIKIQSCQSHNNIFKQVFFIWKYPDYF